MRIEGAKAATRVHFGVLKIVPDRPDGMVAIESTGIGLVPGAHGATLGFSRERSVMMNDLSRCRLVIFETGDDPQSRAFWASALQDAELACKKGETRNGE